MLELGAFMQIKTLVANQIRIWNSRARLKSQLIFTRQLATMISAGIPILMGLKIIERASIKGKINDILGQLVSQLEEGHSLSEALAQHPDVFDRFYLSLIRISEFTGKLELILNQLVKHLENSLKLRRAFITALIYPSVIILTTLVVCIVLLVFVVPTFSELFADVGVELPFATRCIILIGNFLQANYLSLLISLFLSVVGCLAFVTTLRGKQVILWYLLKLPMLGGLINNITAARFSRSLAIILSSGGSIVEGLKICVDNIAIPEGDSIIANCIEDLGEGKSLSESLRHLPFLSPISLQMITVGESSGASDMILEKLAEMYEKDVESLMTALKQLIEPTIILFLALFVGFIVYAMYAPIFSLGGIVGQ